MTEQELDIYLSNIYFQIRNTQRSSLKEKLMNLLKPIVLIPLVLFLCIYVFALSSDKHLSLFYHVTFISILFFLFYIYLRSCKYIVAKNSLKAYSLLISTLPFKYENYLLTDDVIGLILMDEKFPECLKSKLHHSGKSIYVADLYNLIKNN